MSTLFLFCLMGGLVTGLIWFGTIHLSIHALLRGQWLKAAGVLLLRFIMLLILVPVARHGASALLGALVGILVARQLWLMRERAAP